MPNACFKSVTLKGVSHANNCISHNDRTRPPNYLLSESRRGQNYGKGVVKHPSLLLDQVKQNEVKFARKLNGRTKLFREAIILIDKETPLDRIQDCYSRLKSELGMTMLWEYEHNDEGHVDSDGITRKNHHIHFGYTFYDTDTHRSHTNNADTMRKAQDICSESLGLKRGVSKKESRRTGLSHQQYRRMKNENLNNQLNQEKNKTATKEIEDRAHKEIELLKRKFAEERSRLIATQAAEAAHYKKLNEIKADKLKDLETKLAEMTSVADELEKQIEQEMEEKLKVENGSIEISLLIQESENLDLGVTEVEVDNQEAAAEFCKGLGMKEKKHYWLQPDGKHLNILTSLVAVFKTAILKLKPHNVALLPSKPHRTKGKYDTSNNKKR